MTNTYPHHRELRRMRAQDAAKAELANMKSELEIYRDDFSAIQVKAIKKVMLALGELIRSLD